MWYDRAMKQPLRDEIEGLIATYRAARIEREAVDRAAAPRDWAQADLDLSAAAGELGNTVRDVARRLSLVRELSRALAGTGVAVNRLLFEPEVPQLVVELYGRPDGPTEARRAADPLTSDRVRTVTEEFFSRSGMEVAFPYDQLTD